MKAYRNLMERILSSGYEKSDRTGTGTLSVFGHQMRFDLKEGFPVVTGKKTLLDKMIHELLWMISGQTNIAYLKENGVSIWDAWADNKGELGPIYGAQWRSAKGVDGSDPVALVEDAEYYIDQLALVIEGLKENPDSRRLIVDSWAVAELDDMALTPCHCLFQFWTRKLTLDERHAIAGAKGLVFTDEVRTPEQWGSLYQKHGIPERELSCQLYQRSADLFLGVPFNIASYALLTHMVAQVTNMTPGEFIWTGGDIHLYSNHVSQAHEYLAQPMHSLPRLELNEAVTSIDDFTFEDIKVVGYESGPFIKAPVAV